MMHPDTAAILSVCRILIWVDLYLQTMDHKMTVQWFTKTRGGPEVQGEAARALLPGHYPTSQFNLANITRTYCFVEILLKLFSCFNTGGGKGGRRTRLFRAKGIYFPKKI